MNVGHYNLIYYNLIYYKILNEKKQKSIDAFNFWSNIQLIILPSGQ